MVIKGLICAGLILTTSCSAQRKILIHENSIGLESLYEVDHLPQEWKYSNEDSLARGPNSVTIRDMYFARCPGPQLIFLSRAAFRPSVSVNADFIRNQQVFKQVIQDYLEDFYKSMGKSEPVHELVSFELTVIDGIETGVFVYRSKEKLKPCDDDSQGKKNSTADVLLNKFYVTGKGDNRTFNGWGRSTRKFIVLWYASPDEYFEQGVKDFDRMAYSFRYINSE